ncbi:MAG: class I SAM-dependent methyltransferase [bacterium]
MGLVNLWKTFRGDAGYVCPTWVGGTSDNHLRKLVHDPEILLGDLVKPGMTVVDLGCGGGIFSIAMAQMVGGDGKVIAVDVQQRMLNRLVRRAAKLDLQDRIYLHLSTPENIGLEPQSVDFALASLMIHEVPDALAFLSQVHASLKSGGNLLIIEPVLHVSRKRYAKTMQTAREAGFRVISPRTVALCRAVLLQAE